MVWVKHGEPMLFAKGAKGLRLNREELRLEVVEVTNGDWQAAGVLVHDETSKTIAQLLIDMPADGFPLALGVIYCDPMPTFDGAMTALNEKVAAARTARPPEASPFGGDVVHRRGRIQPRTPESGRTSSGE